MVADLTLKEIATQVAAMSINTETKRPYSVNAIEKALNEAHFDMKPNQNAKQQVVINLKSIYSYVFRLSAQLKSFASTT
jgi:ribosome maturation protein Sdo1